MGRVRWPGQILESAEVPTLRVERGEEHRRGLPTSHGRFRLDSMLGAGVAVGVCGLLLVVAAATPSGAVSAFAGRPATIPPALDGRSPVPPPSSGGLYEVTVTESGLTLGSASDIVWTVTIMGGLSYSSQVGTLSFFLPDGAYQFTATSSDTTRGSPGGEFVVNGSAVYPYARFSLLTFPITFTEIGLPSGTNWMVTFDTVTTSSTTNTVAYAESSGLYSFAVSDVPGYAPAPATGTLSVDGSPVSQVIEFISILPGMYELSFTGSALPANAGWSIVVAGAAHNTIGTTLVLSEPNGTYSFSVLPPAGYSASPSSGKIVVAGHAAQQSIAFKQTSASTSSGLSGLDYFWGSLIGVAIALAVAGLLSVWIRRRGPPRGF